MAEDQSITHQQDVPVLQIPPDQEPSVVSRTMSASDIIVILGRHGCPDITENIDLSQCSIRPIAGGGFGDIYEGRLRNGIKVALKCPRFLFEPTEDNYNVLKPAAREMYVWSKCKHVNILDFFGLAKFRDQIAMVSPWMDNGALPLYIARFPGVDRCQICVQVTRGLHYLHGVGTVHGDVKGLNVLVSENGVAKLTDFGNTTLKDYTLQFTGTNNNAANFSVRWTAPELLEGSGGHSRQADIYALGMTILEIITGEVPFKGKSEQFVFGEVAVRRKQPIRPDGFIPIGSAQGDVLWKLLMNCWAYEPSIRPEVTHVMSEMEIITREGLVKSQSLHPNPLDHSTLNPHLSKENRLGSSTVKPEEHRITSGSALVTGEYIVKNIASGNYAILPSSKHLSDIVGASNDVDCPKEWRVTRLEDGIYTIQNHIHPLHASCELPAKKEGAVSATLQPEKWRIEESRIKTSFVISPVDTKLYWGLPDNESGTPIILRSALNDKRNHWEFYLASP